LRTDSLIAASAILNVAELITFNGSDFALFGNHARYA
jgi:predicted nucleic acid-binding protein